MMNWHFENENNMVVSNNNAALSWVINSSSCVDASGNTTLTTRTPIDSRTGDSESGATNYSVNVSDIIEKQYSKTELDTKQIVSCSLIISLSQTSSIENLQFDPNLGKSQQGIITNTSNAVSITYLHSN